MHEKNIVENSLINHDESGACFFLLFGMVVCLFVVVYGCLFIVWFCVGLFNCFITV